MADDTKPIDVPTSPKDKAATADQVEKAPAQETAQPAEASSQAPKDVEMTDAQDTGTNRVVRLSYHWPRVY
jgi:hypothetical protein